MIEAKNRGLTQEQQELPHWSGGLHPFHLQWGRNRLIVVPITIPALAHPDFLIAGTFALPEHFSTMLVGRLVLFYQPIDNGTEAMPIGEVYVYSNGTWCTSGNIPSVRQDTCDKKLIEEFSFILLEGLTYSILSCHHQSLQQTIFDSESQNISHPIDIGTLIKYEGLDQP